MIIYYLLQIEDTVMVAKYKVELTEEEESFLKGLVNQGKTSARKIKRANILLKSNECCYEVKDIEEMLSVSSSTIYRTKRRFVEEGLESALEEGKRPGKPRKLDGNDEALLVTLACSKPPKGRCQWTLSMLGEQIVCLTEHEKISLETIRQRLRDNELKPWQKKMWCIPKLNAAFISRMEHILDLYGQAPDKHNPIVNFDEAGKQLVSHINSPLPAIPGSVEKEDYEYKRVGMINLFMFFDRHRGWRKVKATDNKTAVDFAHCMKELVDEDYPQAHKIRGVMDNLSTHA